MGGNKDILWKGLMEWVFDDLLRFLFPHADQLFDFQKGLTFLDKELLQICPEPEDQTTARHVDKLVKVFRKDGTEEWVLVHLEVQGQTKRLDRPQFGERMFRYFNLIFANYNRPLAAIAIFTGSDAHLLPDRFEYSFMNTRLWYQYNTLNIRDYSVEELSKSTNPFSWVVLIAKQTLLRGKDLDKRLLQGKLFIFRKLYANDLLGKPKIQAILTFLDHYIQFKEQQTNRIFKVKVDQITGKNNTMDIFEQVAEMKRQEGLEEGLKEGLKKAIRQLLANTDFPPGKIAKLIEVPLSLVREVKRELKTK